MNNELPKESSLNHTRGIDIVNLKRALQMMRRYWFLYIIALILAGAGVYLFLEYKIPTYFVATTVLIEDEEPAAAQDLLEGFAVRPGVQNLDNQIVIISSYSLVRKAVEELPFEIDIYRKGFLSQASYYPLNPLRVEPGKGGLPYNIEFVFEHYNDDVFRLSTSSESEIEIDTVLSFGQPIRIANGSFTIYPQTELEDIYQSGGKIYIRFYDIQSLVEIYMSRLFVANATRDGSIVRLSLEGTNMIKDIIFLDKLTEVYINDNLEKKNLEAKRIIDFIDAQLISVSDSLTLTENQLQDFRSRNMIMDVSAQAQGILDQAVLLENEKARLNLEKNYFDYLEEYLSSDAVDEAPVAPASMGIDDPLLANLMQELAGLQAQYFSGGAGKRNPLQSQLEIRLSNTKQSIKETLLGIQLANQMAIDENTKQIRNLNSEAARLPVKERQLLGFERKFNLNNVLYTFLLQRRAEAQIQRASNSPDNVLIDPARSFGLIAPDRMNAIAIAIALAISIPTILILLSVLFHFKIASEDDLNMITKRPVVAHIPHSRLKYNTVMLTEPNSIISESFRSLRMRMDFFVKDAKCPLILVTSSIPGEGKTFSAINLASAYSLVGKKTLLIGFDLRRPTLSKSFELNGDDGLTSHLIGKKAIDDIIYETGFENLYIIPSGSIPPNPGELSSSEISKEMISELKTRFDFIVVDSAPIGVVSDIYSVAALSDALLIVVRHDYTKRSILSATLAEIQDFGINNLGIVLNDTKSRGGSYRYSYKNKYEYKHTPKEKKRKTD